MGSEMGIWAVQAVVVEDGMDQPTALTVLGARIEALSDDSIRNLTDGPWLQTLEDGDDLVEILTNSESATYVREAVARVKRAIMSVAAEIFLGGHHRERSRFTDSVGRVWIMTGGLTPGGPPTESCYPIGMLADIGVSIEPIRQPAGEPPPVTRPDPFTDHSPTSASRDADEGS